MGRIVQDPELLSVTAVKLDEIVGTQSALLLKVRFEARAAPADVAGAPHRDCE